MSDDHHDGSSDGPTSAPIETSAPRNVTSPVPDTQPLPSYVVPVPGSGSGAVPASAPYAVPAQQPQVAMMASNGYARPQANGVHVAVAWVFALFTLGYFLPWAIAATRAKSNSLAIGLLNFFVGWTVIGWIAAFVMACMSDPVHVNNVAVAVGVQPGWQPGYQQPTAAPGWYPQGAGQRYWDGRSWTEHTAG